MCTGAGAGSGSTIFRRRFRRLGGLGAGPGHVQQGSGEGSGEGLGQVQQGSGKGSGWEALVQSQVRFNRVPEKVQEKVPEKVGEVPEKVPEKVWQASVPSQLTFNRVSEKVPEKVPEKAWEALVQTEITFNTVPEKVPAMVWEALVQSQVRFKKICGHLIHGNPAEVFPALGFAARFIFFKDKTLRLLEIPPKLIHSRNLVVLLLGVHSFVPTAR